MVCEHKADHMTKWTTCPGTAFKRQKEKPRDAMLDMRVYWDLHTGSPAAAG